jgi:hypothetical protein
MDTFIHRWGMDTYNCYFNRDKNRPMESPPRYVCDFPLPMPIINTSNSRLKNPFDPFQNELRDKEGNAVPEAFPISSLNHLQWPDKEHYKCDDIVTYICENGVLQFIVEAEYAYSLGCLLQYRGVAEAQTIYIEKLREKDLLV